MTTPVKQQRARCDGDRSAIKRRRPNELLIEELPRNELFIEELTREEIEEFNHW